MKPNKYLKGFNVKQSEMFNDSFRLKTDIFNKKIKNIIPASSFLNQQIARNQTALDNHLKSKPELTTSAWQWFTGSLNVITFGFLDWLTDGYISSFATQKADAFASHSLKTYALKGSLLRAKDNLAGFQERFKNTVGDIDTLINFNSEQFKKAFAKKVVSLMNETPRSEDIQNIKVELDDKDRDAQALGGFDAQSINSMESEYVGDLKDQPIFKFSHIDEKIGAEKSDKVTLTATLPTVDNFLTVDNEAEDFLALKYSDANKALPQYHKNYDQLVAFKKTFSEHVEKMKNGTLIDQTKITK